MELTPGQKQYRNNREQRKRQSLDYSKKTNYKSQGEYCRKYRSKLKTAVYELLGNKCVHCGFSDIRALQIDHINGGGNKEVRKVSGNYYKFLLTDIPNNPEKYQTLCANCNWIKRSINNENRK